MATKTFSGSDHVLFELDATDAQKLFRQMRSILTDEQYKKVLRRAISRSSGAVRAVLRQEIPKEYAAPPSWIGKQVGRAKTKIGEDVSFSIPVSGARGKIGAGGIFKASGGGKAAVTARILKSKATKLPTKVGTGNKGTGTVAAHFMTPSGKVYARMSDDRDDIRPAVGIGVPQMPTNRSQDAVQEKIMDTLRKRIEHEHWALMSGITR